MPASAHLKTALLAGAAWLAISAPTFAQNAPESTTADDGVIVTVTKRSEKVRSVSASVSAVTGKQLEDIGADSYADYIQRVPGAVFNNYMPGVSHVTLRGIATTSGNAQGQGTTGYYINDIPLTEPGWTIVVPDIDTFDVNRVEVLRGPQGTLFGAASMGGAVNYVSNVASTKGFDYKIEGDVSSTKNADVSTGMKIMLNVPLIEDKLAFRVVGYASDEKGYLDNIGAGVDGSNEVKTTGGRLSFVYTPSADTKLTWLSLYQQTDAADSSYMIPSLGDLKRTSAQLEPVKTDVELHSLRVDHDFGWATFTGLASYGTKSQEWTIDYTPYEIYYNADLDLNLTSPLYIKDGGSSKNTTFEARLASPKGDKWEWLIGAMYYKSDKDLTEVIGAEGAAAAFNQSSWANDSNAGSVIAPDGEVFNGYYTTVKGTEQAVFGELSYNFTSKWKLTFGGRLFQTEVYSGTLQDGFSTYNTTTHIDTPVFSESTSKDSGFSPKVALTWKPSEDLMVYGLVSKGFRFGSPNVPGLSAYDIPSGSTSDELINYEVGMRSNWLGNKLLLDATLFYVDWTDIQLRLQTPDYFNYSANGGAAKSQGVEFAATWRATDRLDLSTSITYTDAELTEDMYILYYGTAKAGTALPGSSKWSVANSLAYRFSGPLNPVFTLTHSYLSRGLSDLSSAAIGSPNYQGDYNLFNARLKIDIGDGTSLSFYADNIADERGVTRQVSEVNGTGQGIIKPRTLGMRVTWGM
ncbi:MAG: TonB-dependent receptor [Asticcacaulis sp.]|uniref:TonB-dependent receptor n=1 Tax=Asticcacaulis sp. TaxID=1872648 RepID=UPI0039E48F0B